MSDNSLAIAANISVDDLWRMAQAVAKSRLFGMKTPEEALALMLLAQAEGLHPMTAARDYHIIDGRPSLKSDVMMARFQLAGGSVKWVSLTDQLVSAEFTHPQGGSAVIDWSIERAVSAGLANKTNWRNYPRQMLRARVISEGVRTVYPAACQGVYTPEEVEDFSGYAPAPEQPEVKPERQQRAAKSKPAAEVIDVQAQAVPANGSVLTSGFIAGMDLRYQCEAATVSGEVGKEYAELRLIDANGLICDCKMFKHFADVLADLGLPVQGADLMVEAGKTYSTNGTVKVDTTLNGEWLNIDRCEVENPSPRGAEYRDAKLASAAGVEAPAAPAEAPPVQAKPASTGRPVPPQTPPAQTPQEIAAASAPPAESPAVENAAEATAAGAGDDGDLPDFGPPLDMDYLPAMMYEVRRLGGLDSFDAARDAIYKQARVRLAQKNGVEISAILQSDINEWLAAGYERILAKWKATETHASFAEVIPFTLEEAAAFVSEGGMK